MNCKSLVIHAEHVGMVLLMPFVTLMTHCYQQLEEISEGSDRLKAVEAQGLLLQVKDFKFLISLYYF